jgi:pyrroloquinoline-quinone synthase
VDFWNRLEQVRSEWNVLEHPFYQRWSDGDLTREELAFYAGQYRHAVVALADASTSAAAKAELSIRPELEQHAAEETSHISLWDEFASIVGGDAGAAAEPETAACAETWAGAERDTLAQLVAMYAIESGQPAISETKRAGLIERYGFSDGPATAYFTLHAQLDHEHAAAERALIEERLADADEDALLNEAEAVLRANWELLDGVERHFGRA